MFIVKKKYYDEKVWLKKKIIVFLYRYPYNNAICFFPFKRDITQNWTFALRLNSEQIILSCVHSSIHYYNANRFEWGRFAENGGDWGASSCTYIWRIPGKIGPIAPGVHTHWCIVSILLLLLLQLWLVITIIGPYSFLLCMYTYFYYFFLNSFISPLQFPRPASDDKSKMDVAHLSRRRWFTADRAGNDLQNRRRRRHCDGYGRRTPYTSTGGRPEKDRIDGCIFQNSIQEDNHGWSCPCRLGWSDAFF